MFILISLTQHISGIIIPIVRRTDYVKTACGVCLVVLAAVVQSWDTSCVHTVHDCSQHNQAYTTYSFYIVFSPDDGHNDARNMLS
jgi:hypothetical protein